MADETENHTIRLLQEIREENRKLHNDTTAKLNRLSDDMQDLKQRMTSVEEALNRQTRRIDRLDERVERIERRLDLVDAPAEG